MCFGPSTLGAAAETRLKSRVYKFTPHFFWYCQAFVSSTYGDTELFFRHTFFAEELALVGEGDATGARKEAWLNYTNNAEWMKDEGAMLYVSLETHARRATIRTHTRDLLSRSV